MPPKAKGKKDVAAKLSDRENLGRAETEILSLQRLLELRSHEAVEARRSERLWRERMEGFKGAYAKQEEDTSDIKADMFRQYKTMQEQLMKKIDDAEQENQVLRQAGEQKDKEIQQLQADLRALRKNCDAEIMEMQRKMEDMQVDFTQMLRDTLDSMHKRLAKSQGIV
uniref:Dynein regulatory complex protein 12 n=1 Tax=Dunaliella tertiolecta TaxID=3047 RepID=A0A7S3QR46_DUNTE|mmetsp:Transcript_7474/g.19926  ORF Transcript_7474/g.19926 Transcript_7474/m.19926 type:complete len:168 (+) Transcript_7474:128-631(+)